MGDDILDGRAGADVLSGGDGNDTIHAETCTRVNLKTKAGRAQRDTVLADRGDVIRNRAFCARVLLF